MTHDNLIDIAVGRSRKETKWQNKEVLWSWLVERLSTTHRTSETLDADFAKPLSNGGYTYFRQNTCEASIYANYDSPAGKPVVTYEEFISGGAADRNTGS